MERDTINKTIAEFYGLKYFPYNKDIPDGKFGWWMLDADGNQIDHEFNTRLTKNFKFDEDYNWLMKVVEKCFKNDPNCKLVNHVFNFDKLLQETYKYIIANDN